MQLCFGDMWSVFDVTDYFCFTTNSFIKNSGALVMGAGIAKEVAQRFPNIPKQLGAKIKHLSHYGIIDAGMINSTRLIAFQVKTYWDNNACMPLISCSSLKLEDLAREYPNRRFDLNYPGIGNGKLSEKQVFPLIRNLPDNVYIWKY